MTLTRRQFLTRSLAVGATGMVPGLLTISCSVVRRNDFPVTQVIPEMMGLDQVRTDILYHASLAPSSHNAQPWFVRINGDEWIIGVDPKRLLPVVDPDNRETLLSLGAFAENLSLAASTYGLDAEMEVIANDPHQTDIIRVLLKPAPPRDYPIQRLRRRRTVRNGYLPEKIRKTDLAALTALVPGHMFYVPVGTAHADCIRDGAVEYFRRQTFRDDAQKELMRWLRLGNAPAMKRRDGLTVASLEIEGFQGLLVSYFVGPDDFMGNRIRRKSVEMTAQLAREGGGWLIVTSQGNSVADIIETGRKFERMALLAREKEIALHPMSQFLEEEEGIKEIARNHPPGMYPQFLLRVGYLASYPEPVTLRRPVSWFVQV